VRPSSAPRTSCGANRCRPTCSRARNPELAKADRGVQDNGFWLGALVRAQSEPDRLDRIRRLKPELEKVTASDIQELARKYLQPAASRKALIVKRKPVPASAS
jgi:zinc protease